MSIPSYLRASAVLAASLAASKAFASDPQVTVEGGLSYMGKHYSSSEAAHTAYVEFTFDDHPIGRSGFTWALDVMGGWIDGRDLDSYDDHRFTTNDHIWLVAAGVRFHFGDANAWYRPFFFSIQPTLHTGLTPALCTAFEFTSTLGWQARHWMIGVRHISNAFIKEPNLGETMFVLGVTF